MSQVKTFFYSVLILLVSCSVAFAEKGVAIINGTDPESKISGKVEFTQKGELLVIYAELQNVPGPGKHGFHIHQYGSCEDVGKDAGGHYNPHGTDHGLLEKDGVEAAHAGDLGNIIVDEEGNATYQGMLEEITLSSGHNTVAGRAVIIHAKEDDFGQPTGNAGGRIGCGIIRIVKAEESSEE